MNKKILNIPSEKSKMELTTIHWIAFEILLLVICEFSPVSSFVARKLCHTASGFMMLQLDPSDDLARWFVYSVALSSLAMVWEIGIPFQFRYAKSRDVGISIYLVVVVIFFYTQVPLHIIQPVFYADPLGAIIGRGLTKLNIYNPAWIGKKTIGGTCAVFGATILTLTYGTLSQKIVIAFVAAFVEGISIEYDNLMITAVVLSGYKILT